jgi:hypothetical protein
LCREIMKTQRGEQAHDCHRIHLRNDQKIAVLALLLIGKAIDPPPEALDDALACVSGELGAAEPSGLQIQGTLDGGVQKVLANDSS